MHPKPINQRPDHADPVTAESQLRIADLAYEFWLARGFRDGSPEEDLLRALCACPDVQMTSRLPTR